MRPISRLIHRFARDTSAAVAFETVIVFPFLLWAWVGTFAFFDAYRVYNTSIKATYTIADLVSRQTDTVYGYDIEGMADMLEAMVRDTDGVQMRVTQIVMSGSGDFEVDWSHGTGTLADYATPNIAAFVDRLPAMATGERVILLESYVEYDPAFNVGLNDLDFENFTLTRPRYAGQVPYNDAMTPPSS